MAFRLEARGTIVIVRAARLFAVLAWGLLTVLARCLFGWFGRLLPFGGRLFVFPACAPTTFSTTGWRLIAL